MRFYVTDQSSQILQCSLSELVEHTYSIFIRKRMTVFNPS